MGSHADWIAETLNLCKKNEAIRQSYLLNGIEGYAWSHGLITFSRSIFLSFECKDDLFSYLIANELSHFLKHDVFNDSLREGREGKDLKEKERELLGYKISRESESQADINATKMVINIGLPRDTCMKGHDFFAHHEGLGGETKKDSSHPGYEDRRNSMSEFLKTYKHSPSDRESKGTKGKWKYNRKLNTLTFAPD